MAHCNTSNTITKTHSNRLSLFTCIAHGPLTDWKYNIINFIIQLEVNEKDLEGFFIIMAMIWMSFLKRRSLGQEYNAVSDFPQTILSVLNYWFKKPQGACTICLGSHLLFYSKCTRFTVCLAYSHVSLTVYINQW